MADRLETVTLGTANVVILGLFVLIVAHTAGALTGALDGLGTLTGFALFGSLWTLSLAGTWWVLGQVRLHDDPLLGLGGVLVHGAAAGGVTGATFAAVVVVAASLPGLFAGGVSPASLVTVLAIATGVAAVVGLLVGAALALLDRALAGAAERLVPPDGGG